MLSSFSHLENRRGKSLSIHYGCGCGERGEGRGEGGGGRGEEGEGSSLIPEVMLSLTLTVEPS